MNRKLKEKIHMDQSSVFKIQKSCWITFVLSVTSQPDNASANIQFLQDELKAPTHSDWNEIQHIMRYLKDASGNGLRLKLN